MRTWLLLLLGLMVCMPLAPARAQDSISAEQLTSDVVQRVEIKYLAPLQFETEDLLKRVRALEHRFSGTDGTIAMATHGSTTGFWLNTKSPGVNSNADGNPQVAIYCQKHPGVGKVAIVGAYGTASKSHGLTAALVAGDQGSIQLVASDGKPVHISADQLRELLKLLDGCNANKDAMKTKAAEVPSPFSRAPLPFVYRSQ
jgi:hypothetical protein